eukprot:3823060-Prymnesium_polylepis.1
MLIPPPLSLQLQQPQLQRAARRATSRARCRLRHRAWGLGHPECPESCMRMHSTPWPGQATLLHAHGPP